MSQGQLKQITVYPIKSTAGIHTNHSYVESLGLSFDRRFMLVNPRGQFITARTVPELTQVHTAIVDNGLQVRAPGMPSLTIDKRNFGDMQLDVTVWSDDFKAVWCHRDYDTWFSEFLGQKCRLVFIGDEHDSLRNQADNDGALSFADGYPLLLISQASLDDLNQRAQSPVVMDQFRPNLVVSGTPAFAEDSWRKIRIGEVEFSVEKPCSRCVFTTLDPQTATKSPDNEPLQTLQKYRKGEDGNVYFGQNLKPLNRGKISVFDKVEVLDVRQPEQYVNHAPKHLSAAPLHNQWPAGELKTLLCVAVEQESHDVKTFRFMAKPEHRFHYQAGQYISISLEIDGHPVKRTYTLSSTPSRPDLISITVKRVPKGKASNWLHDTFQAGDTLQALPPAGQFHLGKADQAPLLMISAGVGITPMLSMLRQISDGHQARDIVFLHSAKQPQDLLCQSELDFIASLQPQIQWQYFLTQTTAKEAELLGYQAGRISQGDLAKVADLTTRQVFVCGPAAFMEQVKQDLLALGLPKEQYFDESFGLFECEQSPAVDCQILFDSWDTMVSGNNQQTVLEQAENAGLALPFSCRGGMCGACKVRLDSGEVNTLSDSALTPQEQEQGIILACSCIPQTDLVISQH
ncbi:hybrid-cluster NAD(P)-dependent oxidoreductase [Motilimonas pumila]|uniref:MOSC domain-containing protein n=1 Tax=Motilimonas pumila TaxID=2303987 RepID=A0A418YCU0_9GAMM|nr:hybrid-cluster NAD(P)-dependent oxidoreductase [Motilimonas pumila]RJG42318.1 MOSC domain-containing protein [Motilimonas pumila]